MLVSAFAALSLVAIALSASFLQPESPRENPPLPAMNRPARSAADTFRSEGGYFIENRGQVADGIRYYSRGNPSVAFRDDGIMFVVRETGKRGNEEALPEPAYRFSPTAETEMVKSLSYMLRFEGANEVAPVGVDRRSFNSNFFIGNDSSRWRTDVPNYAGVAYEDLYDGIDLVYHGDANGVKYEFVVKPGADPAAIEIRYEGIESLQLEGNRLAVRNNLGVLFDSSPYSYVEGGGEVRCTFRMLAPTSHGFDCEGYDRSRTLTIDPLIYSTYLGGMNRDTVFSIAVDSSGSAFVTGETTSTDFPTTTGAYDSILAGPQDVFVVKLNVEGTDLMYATFLGGSLYDGGNSLAIDSSGNAYVTGGTSSTNFPISLPTFDPTPNGGYDFFVAELNPLGNYLLYSTYLGGAKSEDWPSAVAVNSPGTVYVTGMTSSSDFPNTTGAFDQTCGTDGKCDFDGTNYHLDAFVARLVTTTGGLSYSTFLGGSNDDLGWSVAVDPSGSAYVTGYTNSSDFPSTAGAFDRSRNGQLDAFVVKLNPAGSGLLYSTFIGGGSFEEASSIALDSSGDAYVTGWTESADFPVTVGALDASYNGGEDAFVLKLNETGGGLLYSTFLGGKSEDRGRAIIVDAYDYAYVTGRTSSADFPIGPAAYSGTLSGSRDAFVTKLDSAGSNILYSTFFGGSEFEYGASIALDPFGNVYIAGETDSRDFPITPDAYDTTLEPSPFDAFVSKMNGALPVRLETSPVSLDVVVDGDSYLAPYTLWCPVGSSHTIGAPSPQVASSTRYAFVSWSDGGAQSHSIDCFSASTQTANFVALEHNVTLNTSPEGLQVLLDGDSHTAPFSFWCAAGTTRSLSVPSPQTLDSTLYSFVSWSDSGTRSHSITCDAPATYTANFTEIVPRDFTVSAFPPARTLLPGGTAIFAVTVTAVGLYDGSAVSVQLVDPLPGFSAECSPSTVTPTASCLLTVSVALSSSPGTYTIAVRGDNGTAVRDTSIELRVTALADFDLQVSPSTIRIEAGKSGVVTVTVSPVANYSGRVVLSAGGIPAGVGLRFKPANISGSGTSYLAFVVSADASPGTYEISVTGIDGDLRHVASLQLVIVLPRPPDTEQLPLWLWLLILLLVFLMAVPVISLYFEKRHDRDKEQEVAGESVKGDGKR